MRLPLLALVLWAVHAGAQAWSLGALSVRSAVGQPLRAEVEVRDLAPDQAQGLQIQLATPQQYQAAGVAFPAALSNAQVSLVRRADGRVFARITTAQAVQEPLLDVLLQARQGGQQQQREYTAVMETPARLPVLPEDDSVPLSSGPSTAEAGKAPALAGAGGAGGLAAAAPAAASTTPPKANAPATVKVKPGDTLGAIALNHKPQGISLDQMLVALFQANPGAFVDGNMNRLRAGSDLVLPSAAQAAGESTGQASTTVAAHTEDFNRYRQRLAQQPARAGAAATTAAATAAQAQVSEGRADAAGPQDRLVLAQATAQAQQAAAQLAQDNAAKEQAARHSELSRNLRELQALQKSLPAAASAPASAAASAPEAVASSASSAASASTAAAGLTAVAAPAAVGATAPGSPVLRAWLDSPVLLPLAGLLLALMVGVVLYRARSWKRQPDPTGEDF